MTISIRVRIKPSVLLRYLLCLTVIMANIGWYLFLLIRQLPFGYLLLALACFAVASSLSLIMVSLKMPVVDLNVLKTGEVTLVMKAGDGMSGRVKLHRSSVIWQYAMALCFVSDEGHVHHVLVLPDSVDRIAFHRLRVALIWIMRHQSKVSEGNSDETGNF